MDFKPPFLIGWLTVESRPQGLLKIVNPPRDFPEFPRAVLEEIATSNLVAGHLRSYSCVFLDLFLGERQVVCTRTHTHIHIHTYNQSQVQCIWYPWKKISLQLATGTHLVRNTWGFVQGLQYDP